MPGEKSALAILFLVVYNMPAEDLIETNHSRQREQK